MTYINDETAHKLPIELYQFTVGGTFYRYTDCELNAVHPITINVYTSEPISRGEINQSDEDSSMSLEIEVDALNPIADFFRTPFLPNRTVFVLVERTHDGAVDAPALIFRGQVAQCVFSGAKATLTCIPTRQVITRSIPTVLCSLLCTNTLYDARCKIVPTDFDVLGLNITVVNGTALTIPGHGKPNGYFSGGFLSAGGLPNATIQDHTGDVFKLLYNFGYLVGMSVTLFPGCDRRYSTCGTKFVNTQNYQGFPTMPAIDPFQDAIY